jgi:hypothetical protein
MPANQEYEQLKFHSDTYWDRQQDMGRNNEKFKNRFH